MKKRLKRPVNAVLLGMIFISMVFLALVQGGVGLGGAAIPFHPVEPQTEAAPAPLIITAIAVEPQAKGLTRIEPGSVVNIAVTVLNLGEAPVTDFPIKFYVDDRLIGELGGGEGQPGPFYELLPGVQGELSMEWRPERSGWHRIRVEVTTPGGIKVIAKPGTPAPGLFGMPKPGDVRIVITLPSTYVEMTSILIPVIEELEAGMDYVPGELLVAFKRDIPNDRIEAVIRRLGVQVIGFFPLIGIYHLRIIDGIPVRQKIASFTRDPLVEFAEPNGIWHLQANDPRFPEQWSLHNEGQQHPDDSRTLLQRIFGYRRAGKRGADIGALRAWQRITDSSDVVIALIDSGVGHHHDLDGNILWRLSYDFVGEDARPEDVYGHGTFVAGIIGAEGNNYQGITGVSWRASIMALKITNDQRVSWGNFLKAMEYLFVQKRGGLNIRLINFSGGGYSISFEGVVGGSRSVQRAMDLAEQEDILFITAAGNHGRNIDREPFYPGSYQNPNIITVAASTSEDRLAGFSNYGLAVDLAAPGEDIMSLIPGRWAPFLAEPNTRGLDNFVGVSRGTSFAAAHVTGMAALLFSLYPEKSALEIKEMILASVERKEAFGGKVSSGGRLRWPY